MNLRRVASLTPKAKYYYVEEMHLESLKCLSFSSKDAFFQ